MILRPKKNDAGPKERALWPDLLSLGLVFPIAIALGFFFGRWIGGLVGHPEGGQWIGLIWGVATGFYELYKVTLRANALDETKDDDGSGGGGA
jgi:hypothetical protein